MRIVNNRMQSEIDSICEYYGLPTELQHEIQRRITCYQTIYNTVLKELTLKYNDGLWWLVQPRIEYYGLWRLVQSHIQDWNSETDMKRKVMFQEYLYDDIIHTQWIHHIRVMNELLVDDYEDDWELTQEEINNDEHVNYDHYYDPFCSDSLYN